MFRKPFLIAFAAFICLAPAAHAARPACASDSERTAMLVRGLQSYFMMAGVGCNQGAAYNKFVTANQSQISAQGHVLKSYFQRVYGKDAERNLNDFVTELANAWSQIHIHNMQGYCKATWELMWRMEQERLPLLDVAQAVTQQPSVTGIMCNNASAGAVTGQTSQTARR